VFGGTQTVALNTNRIGLLLFDASAGQRASVELSASTFASCTLYLFGPYAQQLAASGCTSATTFVDSAGLPLTGTYTIGIDAGASTGSVAVKLDNASDVTGTITIDGPTVTVTTTTPGQDGRWTFSGPAGQTATQAGCEDAPTRSRARCSIDQSEPTPPGGQTPSAPTRADPVDPSTGIFVMHKTDLSLPDVIPVALTRTYNSGDGFARPAGPSMTHPYAMFLHSEPQYEQVDLILPEGGKFTMCGRRPGRGLRTRCSCIKKRRPPRRRRRPSTSRLLLGTATGGT
jgi:hypothetical protein